MTSITFEHTDTFNGESNYSWVKRHTIETNKELSRLVLVRKAKAFAGLTNVRCEVSDFGDMIAIYPKGLCQVVFITYNN